MTTRKRHTPEQVTLVGVNLSPGAGVRAWRRDRCALPHENLPFYASSRPIPTTLLWSFPQARNFAHLLRSRRSIWHSLERKRKIFHEASLSLAVASARRSPDAGSKRREEWN